MNSRVFHMLDTPLQFFYQLEGLIIMNWWIKDLQQLQDIFFFHFSLNTFSLYYFSSFLSPNQKISKNLYNKPTNKEYKKKNRFVLPSISSATTTTTTTSIPIPSHNNHATFNNKIKSTTTTTATGYDY